MLGLEGVPLGKHNLKDSRLDQADKLVEAKKKTYAQVDVVGLEAVMDADSIVATPGALADLILADLEFIETRLGRQPTEAEAAALRKVQAHLEGEGTVFSAGLAAEETQALTAHAFRTARPVVVAQAGAESPEGLMLRAFRESGHFCFLTVGGKENRAWPIRAGTTAWEAAGAIHSDLQKGFIRAEVIGFADFLEAGGEVQAKRAGKLRLETKPYVVQDYDVVNFRFNK